MNLSDLIQRLGMTWLSSAVLHRVELDEADSYLVIQAMKDRCEKFGELVSDIEESARRGEFFLKRVPVRVFCPATRVVTKLEAEAEELRRAELTRILSAACYCGA